MICVSLSPASTFARITDRICPARSEGESATVALEPARIIEGRVLAADTGRPIPHAIIAAAARIQNEHANGYFTTRFLADAEEGPAGEPLEVRAARLLDRAGARRIRLHDVRHTYATLSLDSGVRAKILSDRIAHAHEGITVQIYGHRSTGHDREAAELVADLLRARLDLPDA
jgi:integrase